MTIETATQAVEDLSLDEKSETLKSETVKPDQDKRRRSSAPRRIPRESVTKGETQKKRSQRRRNDSEASSRSHKKSPRTRVSSEMSITSESVKEPSPLRKLKDTIAEKYDKKGSNLFSSYNKNRRELANFENKVVFLQKCRAMDIVPVIYRLSNNKIKNTRSMIRVLDSFSVRAMITDMNYSRKRCGQIRKLLAERIELLNKEFDEETRNEIFKICDEAYMKRFSQIQEQKAKLFNALIQEYKLSEEDIVAGEERLKVIEQSEKEREQRRQQKREERAQQLAEQKAQQEAEKNDEPKKEESN